LAVKDAPQELEYEPASVSDESIPWRDVFRFCLKLAFTAAIALAVILILGLLTQNYSG
jgi:hypothetical protein